VSGAWKDVFEGDLFLGERFQTPEFEIFFGAKAGTPALFQKQFPDIHWARIKQVHGNHVAQISAPTPDWTNPQEEGDGIISSRKNLALTIVTADCLPVLVWDSRQKIAACIHAGWRGVTNRILSETLRQFLQMGSKTEDLLFWIGPHIQVQSFEVDEDLLDQFRNCAQDGNKSFSPHPVRGKAKINLSFLGRQQILEFGTPKNIWVSTVDTFSDPRYSSFRRDKQVAGRQLSFIVSKT
jgi:polyphenol oxidase